MVTTEERAGARSQALLGHGAMLLFSALVAGSFSLGARVAVEMDPGVLIFLRFLLAVAMMSAVLRVTSGRWPGIPTGMWRYFLLGGSFAFYFVMMFEGLTTASGVSSAAVFTLTPLMSAVFAIPLLGMYSRPRVLSALVLGAAGAVWVIFGGDLDAILSFDIGRGEAIFFVGCIAHALYTPWSRRLSQGESAAQAAYGVMLGGTVLLAVYAAPRVGSVVWNDLSVLFWITLAYLVVFTTAGTTALIQFATLRLPSPKVMAYTYLVPSWVVLWDLATGLGGPAWVILPGVAVTIVALLILLGRDT